MDVIDELTRELRQLRKPSEGMSDDGRSKQKSKRSFEFWCHQNGRAKNHRGWHSTIQSI